MHPIWTIGKNGVAAGTRNLLLPLTCSRGLPRKGKHGTAQIKVLFAKEKMLLDQRSMVCGALLLLILCLALTARWVVTLWVSPGGNQRDVSTVDTTVSSQYHCSLRTKDAQTRRTLLVVPQCCMRVKTLFREKR
jgi:hypothetical protein